MIKYDHGVQGIHYYRHKHPRRRPAAVVAATLIATLLPYATQARSQSPQYVARVWQTEQGLPQNSVSALLQDHDGYLWVGTYGGLARFDGERFQFFGSAELPGLGSVGITSLYESPLGVLWVGTAGGGLARVDQGAVTTYTERNGLPSGFIDSIRGDAEGNVWIKTSAGLARFAGTRLEPYPTHRGKAVREFYLQARDGSKWFRSGEELLRFGADGSVATLNVGKPSVLLVDETRDGSVWIAARDAYRLVRYSHGVFSDVPLPSVGRRPLADRHPEFAVTMAEDRDGELLLFTPAGLVRTAGGRLSSVEALPLPSSGGELPKVRSLLADREGNLWVGMIASGLVRLRPAPLTAYGKEEGLADSSFNAVFQDREGRVWLGGDSLYWFDGSGFHRVPGVADINTVAQTRDGDLWFGGYGRLFRWRSGALTRFDIEAFVVSGIYQDGEGTVWIGGAKGDRPGGLYRFREGRLDRIPAISGVQDMAGDGNGGFWVMAAEGLFRVRGGRIAPYDHSQALPRDIAHLYQDSSGTLWFTTNDGRLSRMRDGRLKTIAIQQGLPNSVLLRMLEDGKGSLWVSSHHNILRLSLKALNDFADGRVSSISPVSYGVAEGMRSSDCNTGNPGIWRTNDGRIWFPTVRGVVAVDPGAGSRVPPAVVLEEARANRLALGRDGRTSAPPGNNTFDFRFTALSFSAPENLHFKYRLDPFETDWVDGGTRRVAHYTNMAPGEYSFRVMAANSFGVWSDRAATVHFVLRPHFYQTRWFYALCAIAFLALLWTAYQFRVRRLEQKLKQIRDVIETIPSYLWSALPDGSIDFINQRFLEFSGFSMEQASGSGWQNLLHPEDREQFLEAWRAAVSSGKAMEAEARARRADGQYRWLLIRNVPLQDRRGKIVKWYGTSTDIDDRQRAEQALRESEAYLSEAQRLSHTGSWALDLASNKYVYVSEEDSRIWGLDPKDGPPSQEAVFQQIHPEDRNRCKEAFEKSLREKEDSFDEYRIVLPDGTVKHVHTIRHLVLNHSGDVVRLVGTSVDITERKRAEEALRRSEAYLLEAQRLTHTGAWASDPTTKPLYWSEELFRIFGFDPQRGLPTLDQPLERIHPDDIEMFWQCFQRCAREKVDGDVEYRIVLPDGTVKHVYGLAHPVLNDNGDLVEMRGTVVDITERKRAEQERERLHRLEADLKHLNRVSMMGELAASIAHEVNQPISGVVSNGSACLRWLTRDVPDLEEARETARRIVRDGKRAGEIIARIRALASRKAASQIERVDLNQTIAEVLALIGDRTKKNRVVIRTQFADDLSPVSGDRVQLQQVVLNLVMNAIEAMSSTEERQRELAIATRNLVDQVQVTVEDSGSGLDPDTLTKIFDPFFTTKPSGMGMGLSISRSILQAHEGRLWATSKNGAGTIFHFTVPKHREKESDAGAATV